MGSMTEMKIGDLVRFAHEKGGPVRRVVSVMEDGMIEIHDMGGYFAPHLFAPADDVADIPVVAPPPMTDPTDLVSRAAVLAAVGKRRAKYREKKDAAKSNEERGWYAALSSVCTDTLADLRALPPEAGTGEVEGLREAEVARLKELIAEGVARQAKERNPWSRDCPACGAPAGIACGGQGDGGKWEPATHACYARQSQDSTP